MNYKEKILRAIYDITGVKLIDMSVGNRLPSFVNARLIYVYYASEFISYEEICKDLGIKNTHSIYYYINLFKQKYEHRPNFKIVADNINEIILKD